MLATVVFPLQSVVVISQFDFLIHPGYPEGKSDTRVSIATALQNLTTTLHVR